MVAVPLDEISFPDPKDRPPTILVVDDEVLIRIAISAYLQDCGFTILEARDADEAVAIVKGHPSPIDLVFSDVMMPGSMDGFGLAKWVRQNRPDIPVILTSGYVKKAADAEHVCAHGDIMPKPYDFKLVLARIREQIETAKSKPQG